MPPTQWIEQHGDDQDKAEHAELVAPDTATMVTAEPSPTVASVESGVVEVPRELDPSSLTDQQLVDLAAELDVDLSQVTSRPEAEQAILTKRIELARGAD